MMQTNMDREDFELALESESDSWEDTRKVSHHKQSGHYFKSTFLNVLQDVTAFPSPH